MNKIINFLFPCQQCCGVHIGLGLLRIAFGLLIVTHGWAKFQGFDAMSSAFPDPFGIGSVASLSLAIFAELFCGLALVAGFLTRLAIIPLVVTMLVAFFQAHGGSFEQGGELAFTYLVAFVALFFTGPGRLSVDSLIGQRFSGSCKA